ncbi:MAG: hypothetical protein Q9191_004875 [Dirinaria sp. TL-2023a]
MFVNNNPLTIICDFSPSTFSPSTTFYIATAFAFCILKLITYTSALDRTLPRRRLAVAAGAMADEMDWQSEDQMDWQVDTPPKVFFQVPVPCRQFSRRRTLDEYAEGRRLEYSRTSNPEPALPDAALYPLGHDAAATTPLGNPYLHPDQAYGYGWDQASYLKAITDPISYSEWIAGRQHLYANRPKAYRYLRQTIDTISYGIVAAARSETVRTFCFAGYHAGRYLFTGNPRITHTYVAVAQAANGAKRRVIDITRSTKPRNPYENILFSPEQRRQLRYRERLRGSRNAKDKDRFWEAFADPVEGIEATVPNPLHCMSGALPAPEPATPVKNPFFVPGEWVPSPEQVPQTPRLVAFYDPNSTDVVMSESDDLCEEHSQDTNTWTTILSPAPQNGYGSTDNTATPADLGHNAGPNIAKDQVTVANDPINSQAPAVSTLESNNHGQNNIVGSPATTPQSGVPASKDDSPPVQNPNRPAPVQTTCSRSDTGDVDSTCVELQRTYENDQRFKADPEDKGPKGSLVSQSRESSSLDAAIRDAIDSQAPPSRPKVDSSVNASSASSYKADPVPVLAPPPTSFPLPMTPKAKSPKKRVQFYVSPTTGKPVDRLKKFIIGARIDETYRSSPSTVPRLSPAGSGPKQLTSILSSPTTSNQHDTGPLFNNPALRERLLAMYNIESSSTDTTETLADSSPASSEATESPSSSEAKESPTSSEGTESPASSETAESPAALQQSLPVTPSDDIKHTECGRIPNPNDQLIGAQPEAVSFEAPPWYKRPHSFLAKIIGGGLRRLGINTLRVTAEGSPTLLQSSSAATSITTTMSGNKSRAGEESSSPLVDENSIQDESTLSPTQIDNITQVACPLSTAETLPREVSSSSTEESENLPITDAISTQNLDNKNASHSQVNMSVEPPSVTSLSVGILASEGSSSPSKESSSSLMPADASSPKGQDSIVSPGQVEALAQSSSGSSSIGATLSDEGSSSPTKESSSSFMPADPSSPKEQEGTASPDQVDASIDPLTPDRVLDEMGNLHISGRKFTLRSDSRVEREVQLQIEEEERLAAEKVRKEKEAAEEKARKAREAEEEIKKSGTRRIPLERLIQPLSAEWDRRVDEALAEPMSKGLTSTSTGTTLTRRDIGKILPQAGVPGEDPRGWLNDDAVLAYLQAIVDHGLVRSGHKRGQTPSLHAFNTFFYNNLKSKGPDSIKRWAGKAKIGGKDLLKVEHVFIPVNHGGMHWTLLVVSPRYKRIEYFDSFHGEAREVLSNAKKWLKQELGDAFTESEWKSAGKAGPRQTNGSDCGVFTATTAKMIMLGVDPMAYSAADIPLQRRRMVAELLNRGFTGEFEPNVVFTREE